MESYNGRKVVMELVCGSHSQNLNHEFSDEDKIILLCPTFDDLMYNQPYIPDCKKDPSKPPQEDVRFYDIRKVNHLWWKSNPSYLEILFSKYKESAFKDNKMVMPQIDLLFEKKDEISRMNVPCLFDSCLGIYNRCMLYLTKGCLSDDDLVTGDSAKAAMRALSMLKLLRRFHNSDFKNYELAMRYYEGEFDRKLLLDIRHGEHTLKEVLEITKNSLELANSLKPIYMAFEPNEKTRQEVKDIITQIVWKILLDERRKSNIKEILYEDDRGRY